MEQYKYIINVVHCGPLLPYISQSKHILHLLDCFLTQLIQLVNYYNNNINYNNNNFAFNANNNWFHYFIVLLSMKIIEKKLYLSNANLYHTFIDEYMFVSRIKNSFM